jgi:hypothetical protein
MSLKRYKGSCHCGRVRFEADIDLRAGTGKCNCSICTKVRRWEAFVRPQAFQLIAGEDALSDYQFGSRSSHHLFCKYCGVHAFCRGYLEALGGEFYAVSLAALDDVDPIELVTAPVNFFDGRRDNWAMRPAETRHL